MVNRKVRRTFKKIHRLLTAALIAGTCSLMTNTVYAMENTESYELSLPEQTLVSEEETFELTEEPEIQENIPESYDQLVRLPSTGGMGTWSYTFGGAVLTVAAVGGLVLKQRKDTAENE